MIFTASVIDGFKVILGSMPLQFAMLLTVLTLVPVPEDPTEPGVKDHDAGSRTGGLCSCTASSSPRSWSITTLRSTSP